ncbi:hypothetical protein [Pseudomonas baetica]|jgi:hypothetical protein|uniref:hypothetical protein n=1 Tax=Pseudomonas baetica TaxID=674054 RepID=UPI00240697B0|nr:hypothetical protein [Pseudomonas baetica]MDF9776261.1 hypothetical protein [Pseudomonas baetica]
MKTKDTQENMYRNLDVNDRFGDYRSQIMRFILGFQEAKCHDDKLFALEIFICATDQLENQMAVLLNKKA